MIIASKGFGTMVILVPRITTDDEATMFDARRVDGRNLNTARNGSPGSYVSINGKRW